MVSTTPAAPTDKPDYTTDPYLRVVLGIELRLMAFRVGEDTTAPRLTQPLRQRTP